MKKFPPILFTLMACLALSEAVGAEFDPEATYRAAMQAYDAGDFESARRDYLRLLEAGHDEPEVRFNLGNTYHRLGQPGPAIAQYRRAFQDRPRDPEIRANLAIVQQQVGALVSPTDARDALFQYFSRVEWIYIALLGYWWAALSGLLFFIRKRSRAWRNSGLAGVVVSLLGLSGLMYWQAYQRYPEAVVTRSGVQALFAPMADAVVHFSLPEGSIVRLREASGRWIKIGIAGQEGWVPDEACERLSRP